MVRTNKSSDANGGGEKAKGKGKRAKRKRSRAAVSTQTLFPLASLRLDGHFVIVMLIAPANLRIGFFNGDYSVMLAIALTCGDDLTTDLPPTFFREIEASVRR